MRKNDKPVKLILPLIIVLCVVFLIYGSELAAQDTTFSTCDGIGCTGTTINTCNQTCGLNPWPPVYYNLPNDMAGYWWWNTDPVGIEPPYPVFFPWSDPYVIPGYQYRDLTYLFYYLYDNVWAPTSGPPCSSWETFSDPDCTKAACGKVPSPIPWHGVPELVGEITSNDHGLRARRASAPPAF